MQSHQHPTSLPSLRVNAPTLSITGMGAVTPLGVGVERFVAALRAGRSGVRPFEGSHADHPIKTTVSAHVPREIFDPEGVLDAAEVARLPRCVPMALAAAREALREAGLLDEPVGSMGVGSSESIRGVVPDVISRHYGLILGTGAGGIDFTTEQAAEVFARGGRGSLWTITNATHGNLAGELSINLGLRGPSWCVSTGCASAIDAVGMAMQRLRVEDTTGGDPADDDALDGFVVIGADAHVRWETLAGMEMLRVISTRDFRSCGADPGTASRPFDVSRDGFVLGEGAWAIVIEREHVKRCRSKPQLAELLGYAATCDAYHRVRPAPDAAEAARAMRLAIRDARLNPHDIELIHYHGTATKLNDSLETTAVKLAFGDHARVLRGTSVKSMIGHPQGACGLASLVATLGALTRCDGPAFIPPTINLHAPDVAGGCDLDYTPLRAVPTSARTALINCLAFGAKNAAVVLRAVRSSV